jgi:hypothetical protein
MIDWLFYFESHEQFFSYLATITITGDKAAKLDVCLALTAFSSEGSFTCHTYCDAGPPFLRSYPKDSWFSTSQCRALGERSITTYFKRLRFDAAGTNGARTHDLSFAKREHYQWATATDDCVGIFYQKIYQMPDSAWAPPSVTMATYPNTLEVYPKERPEMCNWRDDLTQLNNFKHCVYLLRMSSTI